MRHLATSNDSAQIWERRMANDIKSKSGLQTIAIVADPGEKNRIYQMLRLASQNKDQNAQNASISAAESTFLRVDFFDLTYIFDSRCAIPCSVQRSSALLTSTNLRQPSAFQPLTIYSAAMVTEAKRQSAKIDDPLQRADYDTRYARSPPDGASIASLSIDAGYRLASAIMEWTDHQSLTPHKLNEDNDTFDRYLILVKKSAISSIDRRSTLTTYRTVSELYRTDPESVMFVRIDQQ